VPDAPGSSRRGLLLVGLGVPLVLALVALRGPVALLAVASVAVLVSVVAGVVPLLRHDGLDWTWQPGRADEVPPEPGIGRLRRLLAPGERDTTADAQLQELVRALAQDRAGTAPVAAADGRGALTSYLAGPPRRLSLDEVEGVITELERLSPTKETP
jgi:hypothetical protein